MAIRNVSFSYSYPNPNPKNAIKIEAKDTRTGEILGAIKAQGETEKMYGQKILSSYLNLQRSTDHVNFALPHIHISDLKVEEKAQRRGIGSALVKRIVEHSHLRNYKGRVIVSAGNIEGESPLLFYDKLGFTSSEPVIRRQIDNAKKYKISVKSSEQAFMCLKEHAIRSFKPKKIKKIAKLVIR